MEGWDLGDDCTSLVLHCHCVTGSSGGPGKFPYKCIGWSIVRDNKTCKYNVKQYE